MDRNAIAAAFVSGRLGQAIFREGEELYALSLDGDRRPASAADLQEILKKGAEYELLRTPSIEAIQGTLRAQARSYNGLFLILSLLDLEVSLSTRVVAAQVAEDILSEPEGQAFVSRRLLSLPLPVQVRSSRHQLTSPWTDFANVRSLLVEVFESQQILDELWGDWYRTLDELSVAEEKKPSLEATLIHAGFFADATRAIRDKNLLGLNALVVSFATDTRVVEELRNVQTVLTAFRSRVQTKFFGNARQAVQRALRLKRDEAPAATTQQPEEMDAISALIYGTDEQAERPRRYVGAFEAKARVDKQISAIRDALFAGKTPTAQKYLEELLAFQLGQGDREFAAMSLCALTTISLDANQFDMADRLSAYALKLTSDDKVVYTNRAEVFKQRGHFDAALKAYEEAIERFGPDRYARNGYADVLKDKGRFEEALKAYKNVQKDAPDDPVAFNGEVSVLRAKGELRVALSVAVANAKRFEYDAVTRATLASSLASLGKYDESVRQYRVAIKLNWSSLKIQIPYVYALRAIGDLDSALKHADSVIDKLQLPRAASMVNAKASLLRSAGRLEEAGALYENLLRLFPTYTPARFGAAAVRVLNNQIEEAQTDLPETEMESEMDWYGFRLRALSFAKAGHYEKAEPRLSFGTGQCPWIKERTKLETALGFVELYSGETGRSIAVLNKNLHQLDDRDRQIRMAFLGHAHAQKGATEVATIMLGWLFNSKDPTLQSVRGSIIAKYKLPLAVPRGLSLIPDQMATQELGLAIAA
ncbi:MAG: tetratricopeptide repeat protein [Candidatus Sulfotelmatobacter sp.]